MTNQELISHLLKICTRSIVLDQSVTAGVAVSIGQLSTLTGGIIPSYEKCLGAIIINVKGSQGYDTYASVNIAETGDVLLTPWISQSSVITKISFFYY